jgi:pimeloyl-ACP methyl ester carboxylesterase
MMGAYERSFDVQAVIERMQRVLPRLEQVSIVPDAGHGIISENPAWVNRSLLQWFRRL